MVEAKDPATFAPIVLGVGRLSKQHGVNEAEFALLISDEAQGQGLGTELLRRLLAVGRDEHVARITADILHENVEMQRVCMKLGFHLAMSAGDAVVKAVIDL